jgi:hypothetical protein
MVGVTRHHAVQAAAITILCAVGVFLKAVHVVIVVDVGWLSTRICWQPTHGGMLRAARLLKDA